MRQVLSSMLTQRSMWGCPLGLPDDLWEAWAPHLIAPLRAFLDDAAVQAEFAELAALEADGSLIRAEAAGDALVPDLRSLLHTWHAIDRARQDGDWAAVSRSLAPLRASLKQKGRAANWAPGNPKASIKALQGYMMPSSRHWWATVSTWTSIDVWRKRLCLRSSGCSTAPWRTTRLRSGRVRASTSTIWNGVP